MSQASLTPSRMGIMTSLRTVTSYLASLGARVGVCCPKSQRVAVPASRMVMAQEATNTRRGIGVLLALGRCKVSSWRWKSSERLIYTWVAGLQNQGRLRTVGVGARGRCYLKGQQVPH